MDREYTGARSLVLGSRHSESGLGPRQAEEEEEVVVVVVMLTLRVREHAHQGSELRRTTPMGNVKPATSRAMHPAGLGGRLLLVLWLLLLLLLLLVLLHDGQKGGVGAARRVRSVIAGSARTDVVAGIRGAMNRGNGTLERYKTGSRRYSGTGRIGSGLGWQIGGGEGRGRRGSAVCAWMVWRGLGVCC